MASKLSDVLTGQLCSGCGGCAALAPGAMRMRISEDGFLRPQTFRALKASEKSEIETICPGIGQSVRASGRRSSPVWGPHEAMWRGHSLNPDLRYKGASGGALSGFLVSLLEAGEVDGVIHIGADPDQPLGNVTRISHSVSEVMAHAGSRYAPSSPLDCIPGLSKGDKVYAFVGKPCDVSALSEWQKIDPNIAKMVPILVSFLCAGIPSLKGSAQICSAMGVPPEDVFAFDHRGPGWPGAATARTGKGKTHAMSYAQSWGAILSKHVQHRCKLCADGAGAFADVVFGDAWEADADGYPSFEDRPGQTAIITRTQLGARLLAQAQASGAIQMAPLDPNSLTGMQPGQARRRRVVLARLAGLWLTRRAVPKFRGFGLARMAMSAGPPEWFRNFAGMIRRARRIPRKGHRIC